VKGLAQIVAPKEPLEAESGGVFPILIPRDRVGLEAGGDGGVRLEGLLIEAGRTAALPPEPVAANRGEIAALRCLRLHEPAQRRKADLEHLGLPRPMAA